MRLNFLFLLFSLVRNGKGVFISDVVKGGAADLDGRLMQGDQILSVDGEDMRQASQETVAAILKVSSTWIPKLKPSLQHLPKLQEQSYLQWKLRNAATRCRCLIVYLVVVEVCSIFKQFCISCLKMLLCLQSQ